MTDHPYHKRYQSDALARTSHLTVEEKGALVVLTDLMWDRGGPVPDDAQWLARVAGCSTRRWGILLAALVEKGMVEFTWDGKITCPDVDKQRAKDQAHSAKAVESGRKGGYFAHKNAGKIQDKSEINSRKIEDKSEINQPELADNNDLAEKRLPGTLKHRARASSTSTKEEEREEDSPLIPPSGGKLIRGKRLSPDWKPSPAEAAYAHELGLDADEVATDFRDYWCAKPGAGALSIDWTRNWQGWCRREAKRRPRLVPQASMLLPLNSASPVSDAWGLNAWLSRNPEVKMGTVGDDVGKRLLHGWLIDEYAPEIAELAKLPPDRPVDWTALGEWMRDGLHRDGRIIDAIRWAVGRTGYQPPHSLRFFDRAVRNQRSRSAA